jgi:hypothetical protein
MRRARIVAVIGVAVLMTSASAVPVAHVYNLTKAGRQRTQRQPSRMEQVVQANDWWCAHKGQNQSLGCQRHHLQKQYAAAEGAERERINQQLGGLLLAAGEPAIAAMQDETRRMIQSFCALPANSALSLCETDGGDTVQQRLVGARRRALSRRHTGGHAAKLRKGKGGGRTGVAKLWTSDTLAILRGWWCSDRKHVRESRCSRGVRWTRQQPGLGAMRRMYCEQRAANAPNSATVVRLCHGIPRNTAELGASGGTRTTGTVSLKSSASSGGNRQRRPAALRKWTVLRIMLGLLVLAVVLGCTCARCWQARRHGKLRKTGIHLPVEAEVIGIPFVRRRVPRQKRMRGDAAC